MGRSVPPDISRNVPVTDITSSTTVFQKNNATAFQCRSQCKSPLNPVTMSQNSNVTRFQCKFQTRSAWMCRESSALKFRFRGLSKCLNSCATSFGHGGGSFGGAHSAGGPFGGFNGGEFGGH